MADLVRNRVDPEWFAIDAGIRCVIDRYGAPSQNTGATRPEITASSARILILASDVRDLDRDLLVRSVGAHRWE
jgi:hypothetical protein